MVAAATGRDPWLLGPEDEARLAFMGATMGRLSATEGAFVCDVGGGSTEVALGSQAGVTASASFDVGAFALAERHFRHDPPTSAEIDAARAAAARAVTLDLAAPTRLALATGGSARALAKLTGPVVAEDELAAGLRAVMIAEKQAVKNPQRRRTLPAGIVILEVLHSVIDRPLTIVAAASAKAYCYTLQRPKDRSRPAPYRHAFPWSPRDRDSASRVAAPPPADPALTSTLIRSAT